jgi:tRNA(Met) cytidine acetyltransferase
MHRDTCLEPLTDWLEAHQAACTRGFLWIKVSPTDPLADWVVRLSRWMLNSQAVSPLLIYTVISDRDLDNPERVCSAKHAQRLLGLEFDLVVFDALSGFNPDALAQVTGTVKGGGVFVLITTDPASDAFFDDPEKARLTVHPFSEQAVGNTFLNHIAHWLNTDPTIAVLNAAQDKSTPNGTVIECIPALSQTGRDDAKFRLLEQSNWVADTFSHVNCNESSVHVLLADRGRGKSSALGLLANQLHQAGYTLLVVAPSKAAVKSVYQHADLPESVMPFMDPSALYERLLGEGRPCDADPKRILLVDEAASIAPFMLARFKNSFYHVIYATTVSGYEGTGQGFRLRFLSLAEQHWGAQVSYLNQPIRWAEGDTLERSIQHGLFLDHDACARDGQKESSFVTSVEIKAHAKEDWLEKPELLKQAVALLCEAHYRTTPGDIRVIMDSPNVDTWVAMHNEQVIGVAVIAQEGPLPADLCESIWQGRRRPKGHLFPQTMIAQQGFKNAGMLTYWRVVRIAVSPEHRQAGVASTLIDTLREAAKAQEVDVFGASCAITHELFGFWEKQGFHLLRLGTQLDKTAGGYAALMGQALNSHSKPMLEGWCRYVRTSYTLKKSVWLDYLEPNLEKSLVNHLSHFKPLLLDRAFYEWAKSQVSGFAHHHRSWESSLFPIIEWLEVLSHSRLLQELTQSANSTPHSGLASPDKATVKKLREAMAAVLESMESSTPQNGSVSQSAEQ